METSDEVRSYNVKVGDYYVCKIPPYLMKVQERLTKSEFITKLHERDEKLKANDVPIVYQSRDKFFEIEIWHFLVPGSEISYITQSMINRMNVDYGIPMFTKVADLRNKSNR